MILDTSVLVELIRGNVDVENKVKDLEEKGEPLRASTILRLSSTTEHTGHQRPRKT